MFEYQFKRFTGIFSSLWALLGHFFAVGVYTADIDTRQQKVVVTGNIDAGTLLRKLNKSGKHAELWPENPADRKADKNPGKPHNKEKSKDQEKAEEATPADAGKNPGDKELKPTVKVDEPAKVRETTDVGGDGIPVKNNGAGGANVGGGGAPVKVKQSAVKVDAVTAQVVKDTKAEGKKPETGAAVNQPNSPPVEKKGGEGAEKAVGGAGGSGTSGKKKKKKVQIGSTSVEGEASIPAPASRGSPTHNSGPPPLHHSPPRHHGHQYPPHYYAPPPPAYAVSYNTAHPSSSSSTASYYAAPQPNTYSYAYAYPGNPYPYAAEAPAPDFEPNPPRQPLDSFEMFSDENPNGCWVM
ncbi:hypothetical protein RJ639_002268 [Escallonia herrerae]|uniref:HMA domain-containing protein n=1 Tax=Escallonia herrerae TaxID=1293975 RepID=A0AA88XNV6_9ASTE|nr:hypothetical protein RJ639_002268 [Escallonia herrerae]